MVCIGPSHPLLSTRTTGPGIHPPEFRTQAIRLVDGSTVTVDAQGFPIEPRIFPARLIRDLVPRQLPVSPDLPTTPEALAMREQRRAEARTAYDEALQRYYASITRTPAHISK